MLLCDRRERVSESLGGLQSWTGWTGQGTVRRSWGFQNVMVAVTPSFVTSAVSLGLSGSC